MSNKAQPWRMGKLQIPLKLGMVELKFSLYWLERWEANEGQAKAAWTTKWENAERWCNSLNIQETNCMKSTEMIDSAKKRVTKSRKRLQTVTLPPATGLNTQRIRFIDSVPAIQ